MDFAVPFNSIQLHNFHDCRHYYNNDFNRTRIKVSSTGFFLLCSWATIGLEMYTCIINGTHLANFKTYGLDLLLVCVGVFRLLPKDFFFSVFFTLPRAHFGSLWIFQLIEITSNFIIDIIDVIGMVVQMGMREIDHIFNVHFSL